MSFSVIEDKLVCSYDFSRNGVIDEADPHLTFKDEAPLPVENNRVGLWAYKTKGGVIFEDVKINTCLPQDQKERVVLSSSLSLVGMMMCVILVYRFRVFLKGRRISNGAEEVQLPLYTLKENN